MAVVLGIDTGGTFTDGAIVNTTTEEVLCKAKALTTAQDLSIGIGNCLDKLPPFYINEISFVALSTTLATNAIVENKRSRTGVILMGKEIDETLPADEVAYLDCRINIKGQVQKVLDVRKLDEIIESMRDKIDVLAVSGMSSVRNPEHENQVRDRVRSKLAIPVVCAHELSCKLGYYERTVTCILNAGLMTVIDKLITCTGKCLTERNINTPITIVKGDGALMDASIARERPVETLLSGPAASIIGAKFLTGLDYGIVLDMGGTTTDIGNLTNGTSKINEEGATVGGWVTQVRATDVCTYGLGGDSHIYYDNDGVVCIGPRKVLPICALTKEYPHIIEEMTEFRKPIGHELLTEKSTDCFVYVGEIPGHRYTGLKKKVIDCLREKPHSLFWLADHFQKDADKLCLTSLVEDGVIKRASMTPSDLLAAEGRLNIYDQEGAKIAVKIMADLANQSPLDFIIRTKRFIYRRIAAVCIESACSFEGRNFDFGKEPAAKYFMSQAFNGNDDGILRARFTLSKPIIALGAPVKAWLYNVGRYLDTTVIIPEYAEVANAIGAAVAQIVEEKQATIRYDAVINKYVLYTERGREVFDKIIDAKDRAVKLVSELAKIAALAAGCEEAEVSVKQEDRYTRVFTTGARDYTETVVKAVAHGKPKWGIDEES